jgi:SAM-dependent methyltransferase
VIYRVAVLLGAMLTSAIVAALVPLPGRGDAAMAAVDQPADDVELTEEQRAARDEGRILYWKTRRTYQQHLPGELSRMLAYRVEDPEQVLHWMAVQPGEVVGDIGCGAGFYTLRLAAAAGAGGAVYGTDIDRLAVELLRERVDLLPCEDCAPIDISINAIGDVGLLPGVLDAALMANLDFYSYPDLGDESVAMLRSVVRALRPGGRLVVVQDLDAAPGGDAVSMERHFRDAGLVLGRSYRGTAVVAAETEVPWVMLEFHRPQRGSREGESLSGPGPGRQSPDRPAGLGKPGRSRR